MCKEVYSNSPPENCPAGPQVGIFCPSQVSVPFGSFLYVSPCGMPLYYTGTPMESHQHLFHSYVYLQPYKRSVPRCATTAFLSWPLKLAHKPHKENSMGFISSRSETGSSCVVQPALKLGIQMPQSLQGWNIICLGRLLLLLALFAGLMTKEILSRASRIPGTHSTN